MIPGGSGLEELANLSGERRRLLVESLAPPLGVDELPPAADDGLLDVLLEPPVAGCSRLQPARASANEAAMIISTFMDPPWKGTTRIQQTSDRPASRSTIPRP